MSEKFTRDRVYKILPLAAWEAAQRTGAVQPSADDARDGFVHLSAADQIAGTLARHYAGETTVALVAFAATTLGEEMRWEASRGGALFPHFYGDLRADLAVGAWTLRRGADGAFALPADIA